MRLERKHAVLFFVIAVWNVITWSRFIKALIDDDGRSTGFYVAHTFLIVVNFVIAIVLAVLGAKVWKAPSEART